MAKDSYQSKRLCGKNLSSGIILMRNAYIAGFFIDKIFITAKTGSRF